uniref:Choline transporter-like protein n=1 Tax=Electrophorus electricus TaxID=8005 RepID=A0A4W4GIJ3_ELEEL
MGVDLRHVSHTSLTLTLPSLTGEPAAYDPTFNGPIHNRSCTDIICCVLFMLVVTGYLVVGILAWLYGDPRHVLYPRNSTGMFCGVSPNQDKPNVFYFNILNCATATNIMAAALNGLQCPTTQICVSSCPSNFWALNPLAYLPNADLTKFFQQDLCVPSFNLSTTSLVRMCVQKRQGLHLLPAALRLVICHGGQSAIVYTHTHSCLTHSGLVIAMVVSLLFLLLLRFLAAILIWILILGVLAVGAFGKCVSVCVCVCVCECVLILLSVAEAVLLLTLIFLRTRILIAIALIRESSKAVSYMMTTLIYPLVSFVFLVVCVSYWGITALYLATSGAPVYNVVALNMSQSDCSTVITGNQTCDPLAFNSSMYPSCPSARCVFIKYNKDGLFQRNLFNLQIYNVFAFLWCVNFVIALGQCTLAGAFASYYWAFHKPSDIPTCPLASSFMRALRYHVGSLAFGALILTIVQIIRIILEYIDHKCRAAQNCCVRFILCCLKCCFWCLEKFIKFLNRNAYIMIAIYGKNFCVSAKNAVVFGAYLIAHGFFSVYNMCVDTLFLCFLEDLERNDGSAEKPYYMSKSLMKILNKKNKQPNKQ